MLVKHETLNCLLDSINRKDRGKSKVYRDVFMQWVSCKGISVLVIKDLHVRWVNERTKIHNQRRKGI